MDFSTVLYALLLISSLPTPKAANGNVELQHPTEAGEMGADFSFQLLTSERKFNFDELTLGE
jgi:hypothetical protein